MEKKVFAMLLMVLLAMAVVGVCGCSDDERGQDDNCYTIHVNGIDANGIVSSYIVNMPEQSVFAGYCILFFDKADLPNQTISSGDELDIKIISSQSVQVVGWTTGDNNYYKCKVKPCK